MTATGGDAAGVEARRLAGPGIDDAAWDAFVAATPFGSYLQRAAWARVKAVNGWASARVVARSAPGDPAVGAQLLLRRPRGVPWAFAYAPRGPVAEAWTAEAIGRFTEALRSTRLGRISHVRIDPEIESGGAQDIDGSLAGALRGAGWRSAPAIQPSSTRIVDVSIGEAALWDGLRKKWRQYVNKARTAGVTVVEADGDPIAPFYRIYRETAERAGFLIRTERAYRDIWEAYRPSGDATMLFARDGAGTPQAALFLIRNGTRVVEPYGGMTAAGADLRANYLLKWEAIRRASASGATVYDMWGLAQPGIAHFKAGFGGREVRYIGAYDLNLSGIGRRFYAVGQAVRVQFARRRAGLSTTGSAAEGTAGSATSRLPAAAGRDGDDA